MTWPEYLAGCCRIGGRLTRLTLQEADVLCVLLLSHPDTPLMLRDMIERVWPDWTDAQREPDTATDRLKMVIHRLRHQYGIPIENRFAFGYRIPRDARGHDEPMKLAA